MSIYFTSDLHFSHKNILDFNQKYRKYNNIEEMNEGLIKLWNKTIKDNDEVYLLGDVFFGNKDIARAIIEQLNGKIHLIYGNHDQMIQKEKNDLIKYFASVQHYLEKTYVFNDQKLNLIMMHYPISSWNKMRYGAIHLHGHLHEKHSGLEGKILNVGYDYHGKILSLKDIYDLTKDLKIVEHH